MAYAVQHLRATYAFVERNANLVKRYWSWEIVWLAYSISTSLSVAFIGLGAEQMSGGEGVDGEFLVLYLVIGTIVWRYLSAIFVWITELIAIERWEGTIEYTLMAPVPRIVHIIGQTAFAVTYSMLFTSVVLVANVLIFDINLANANLLSGMVMLLAGSFSFVGIGVVASVLPLLFPERGAQMTHVFSATLLLISGVYYPIEVLPGWLQKAAVFSPATYVLDGARRALLEGATVAELWPLIWPVLIMGAVLIPIGLAVFRSAERYAKRSGKLHRNG